jgi:hypothetical protein
LFSEAIVKSSEIKQLLLDAFGHLDDRQLLALTLYGEARGERTIGKIAVGSVILERVDHRDWDGRTVREVCLMPYQFSCFLPDDPNFPKLQKIAAAWDENFQESASLRDCYRIASELLDGATPRDAIIAKFHATQYKTLACEADWADKMKKVTTIGAHEFYA